MKIHLKTRYVDEDVELTVHLYAVDPNKKSCRIDAVDPETGEPISTLTVYTDTTPELPSDVVLIKDYSENEGMMKTLTEAKVGVLFPKVMRIEDAERHIFPLKIIHSELLELMKKARE